ncbi:hypothetical protein [Actinomadura sp. 21ATH]|uniref:HEAT repeat domain-containing protein n=1 Tax=Actinomadura sp. 21ATH TaxID=1735444 RepID=UPI0035BEBBB9
MTGILAVVYSVRTGIAHDQTWAAEIDLLLRGATATELMRLENDYRSRHLSLRRLLVPPHVHEMPLNVDDLELPADGTRTAVLALASLDRSGHLREAAVRELARVRDDDLVLPFLLLRLNDVVDPVRLLAAEGCRRWLEPEHVALLVRMLPLIDGLNTRRRAGPAARIMHDALASGGDVTRAALWSAARTAEATVRASSLRLLSTAEPVETVRYAFTLGDPALRRWAARVAVSRRLPNDQQRALLPLLESDPNPRIRLCGLRARVKHPDAEAHLRRAVLDPDARVRYLARSTLRALGRPPSRQVYTDALENPTGIDAIIGALAGLSDIGTSRDLERLLPFLTHPTARVRAEACRAVAIIDPSALAARLDELRMDPSAKVRRYSGG